MILTDVTAVLLAACLRCQSPVPPHHGGPGVVPAPAVSGSLLFVPAPANIVGGEAVLQLPAPFSLLVRHQSAAYLYRFAAACLNEWPLSVLESYSTPRTRPLLLSQAFVDFLSRGLDAEYKSKGIIVQVSRTSGVPANGAHGHVVRSCDQFRFCYFLSPECAALFRRHQDEQHPARHADGAHSGALRLQRPQHRGTGESDQRLLASRCHGTSKSCDPAFKHSEVPFSPPTQSLTQSVCMCVCMRA